MRDGDVKMRRLVSPVYQPIMDVESGYVSHYEMLARIPYSVSASLPGDSHVRLLALAEEIGFIDLIDISMLSQAFIALKDHGDVNLSVNVSADTINYFCASYLSTVFSNMDLVDHMVFEITETKQILSVEVLLKFCAVIRSIGGKIAMDDYGVGFCDEKVIKRIRPDYMKLDGIFANKLHADGHDEKIEIRAGLRQIIDFVRDYGGEVIAEHIDTERKLQIMKDLNVRYMQGYLIGKTLSDLPFITTKATVDRDRILIQYAITSEAR